MSLDLDAPFDGLHDDVAATIMPGCHVSDLSLDELILALIEVEL